MCGNVDSGLIDALDMLKIDVCNGWGHLVNSDFNWYFVHRFECYLVVINSYCCCVWKPECPDGLTEEVKVIPWKVYNSSVLEIGSVKTKENVENDRSGDDATICKCIVERKDSLSFNLPVIIFVSVWLACCIIIIIVLLLKKIVPLTKINI